MREIPFDPNDPQAALRQPTPPPASVVAALRAVDQGASGAPSPHSAAPPHSVAPPGYTPPPTPPIDDGWSPGGSTPQEEAAAFLAMPTNTAEHRSGVTAVSDALMSTSTGRRSSVGAWAAGELVSSAFGYTGYGLGLVGSMLFSTFGGSGWDPPVRPRSTPRIR